MSRPPRNPFFKKLSVLMVGTVSLLAFLYAVAGKSGYLELKRHEEKNRELTRKVEQLQQENKEILGEIKALKSDPKAIEKIAREELGMVKRGEVKITTNPDRQSQGTKPPGEDNSDR